MGELTSYIPETIADADEFVRACIIQTNAVTTALHAHGALRNEPSESVEEEQFHQLQFETAWESGKSSFDGLLADFQRESRLQTGEARAALYKFFESIRKHELPFKQYEGSLVERYRKQKSQIEQEFEDLFVNSEK